jgi:acetyl coenzyme A synthetase (ADP forming)-like protein
MDRTLAPFFRPAGVALVGASHEPGKLGYGVAFNLVHSGYAGDIHFVNPRGGTLLERPVYPTIAAIPDPVDLAVLIIPAVAVPEALRECAGRGIRAAIILSGGFRETGEDGAALEAQVAELARTLGIRLIGPNCVGLIDTHLPIDTTFLPAPGPTKGDIAFISHSGAICAAVTDWASGLGFGLSHLISLGNQADVTESDVLEPVASDPDTRVLTLYLEGVTNGRRFVEVATHVTPHRPVIALKVGRSAAGRRAVTSHTGALAGEEAAYNAAFRRAGVIRAETSEELFNWARALAWCPLPRGRAFAVLTNAGGPGVIAADALESQGLQLATLGDKTRRTLGTILPPFASIANPVDMLASATPRQYAECLRLLLADGAVDGVAIIVPPPPRDPAEAVVEAMIPVIHAASKPVVVALMGEHAVRGAAERLRAAKIPDYRFPEQAASALAALAERSDFLRRPAFEPAPIDGGRPELARQALAAYRCEFGSVIVQEPAARVLEAYGIRTAPMAMARTAKEAAAIAARFGFPVALKVASPDIPHKSEVGGVRLNVATRLALAHDFGDLLRNVHTARPAARINGVCVQPMLPAGQELIVGAVRDPQFGPLVMAGSGGVEVECLRDVAFALAPLARDEAEAMLDATWAGRRLRGYRNLAAGDRDAVVDTILRIGQLVADLEEIQEIEINPLSVFAAGTGALAVDVRIRAA